MNVPQVCWMKEAFQHWNISPHPLYGGMNRSVAVDVRKWHPLQVLYALQHWIVAHQWPVARFIVLSIREWGRTGHIGEHSDIPNNDGVEVTNSTSTHASSTPWWLPLPFLTSTSTTSYYTPKKNHQTGHDPTKKTLRGKVIGHCLTCFWIHESPQPSKFQHIMCRNFNTPPHEFWWEPELLTT